MKKKFKKMALALVIVLTFALSSVWAFALPAAQVVFGVTSPQGQTNANVAVVININTNTSIGIGAATTILTYDQTKLQIVSCTKGAGFTGTADINTAFAANQIKMAYADPAGATATGEFYRVTFKILTSTMGDIALTLAVTELTDSNTYAVIPYTISQGKVTVIPAPTPTPVPTRAPTNAPTSSTSSSAASSQSVSSSQISSTSVSATPTPAITPTGKVSAKDAVIALINALPSVVNVADKAAIEAGRAVYDLLSPIDKALVTNYNQLLSAEQQLALLNANGSLRSSNMWIIIIVSVVFVAALIALLYLLVFKKKR
jgi:hypothetical protein